MTRLRIVKPRRLFVSPSQLKSLVACERRWYLETQAGVARDGDAGGFYLAYGRLLDEAVERFVADPRTVFSAEKLAETVRAARRGNELTSAALTPEKWVELADKAIRALRRLDGAKLLPPTGTPSQFKYRVEVPGAPVTLVGRADYRGAGRIWDLKTTSDRGPGKGPGEGRSPNALTDATLHDDFQARVYAAAEFFAQPTLLSVSLRWVYSSSTTNAVWAATAFFTRAETLAWFDANVRVHFPRMLELAETEGLDPDVARANHDSCGRCFVKGACSPYRGAQNTEGAIVQMDLAKLRARRDAVNRPAAPASAEAAQGMYNAGVAKSVADQLQAEVTSSLTQQLEASVAMLTKPSALTLEAAAVAGGTQDDRRADVGVVTVVGVSGGVIAEGMQLIVSSDVPPEPTVIDTVAEPAPPRDAAPAVALREELAEQAEAAAEPSGDAQAIAADMDRRAAPEPRRGRGRPRKPRAEAAPEPAAEPTTRSPTAEELTIIETLDASARLLDEQRKALAAALVVVLDAASAARNALRAAGVRFEGDPS